MLQRTANTVLIELPEMKIKRMEITLVGDSPLICHRWSDKAKKEMLDKQMKKAKQEMDELDAALPAGSEGEIAIRGPKVTAGYWRDPETTAASFHDGWLRSGDVGYLDADGFLYLTDRKKDLIISGGENVASSEVERVIYDLPQVSEAAVVGVADARWGERPVAVVVLRSGETLTYEALASHCRERLAGFKVPRELVVRDALPRNPSGKVLKRVLREELAKRG